MKKIFICSPFRGNIEENKKAAQFYAKIIIGTGRVPLAPPLYFLQFLDEDKPNERVA